MADAAELTTATASGDEKMVKLLVEKGAEINGSSVEGFRPLCIAAFWGADINAQNRGTQWTALHCAAFQGHGKVVMILMRYNPDLNLKGHRGRTAIDFASALENIWPFFAAAGCQKTPKEQLIKMDIVKKISSVEEQVPQPEKAYFSRPGSAYVMKSQSLHPGRKQPGQQVSLESTHGDILMTSDPLNDSSTKVVTSFSAWRS